MNKIFKALLLTIFISLVSCDKETNELSLIENQTKSPFVIKIIGKEEVNSNPYLKKELEKFKQKTSNTLSRDVYNSEYHFIVDTDNVKYVKAEDGSIHSYTFSINAIEGSNLVENLVITSQSDGSYKTEILAYKFLDNNKLEINSVELDNFDTSDYLSRYSFSYTCTTTVTFTTTFDDNCTCEYVEIHNVDTNCNYTYIDTGNGGGGGSGGGSAWDDGVWYSGGGGSSNSNSNSNTTTQTVTSPNIHLGNWLLETLGIGNLGATGDELTIFNWINNNYSPTQVLNGSNPFFDVYTFYIENSSVTNINDVVKEIILIMNANPSLTFEEALYSYTNDYFSNNPNEFKPTYDFAPNDIINISDYLDCFDSATANDTFEMTIYVEQPIPGKRNPYKIKNLLKGDIDVGHTFLSLSMTPSSGVSTGSVNQTIGFYPNPLNVPNLDNPVTSSVMVDNGLHNYNISVTTPLTFNQFQDVITYLEGVSSSDYDLNNLNCTDIGIQAAAAGDLILPDTTTGNWNMVFVGSGSGSNPGDLGEDIRALSNPNVTVNTTSNTGLLSNGSCK